MVLVASGAEPCADTSTRLITSLSCSDGLISPRSVTVPETLVAAADCAAPAEDDGLEELLQPASATAATVISDQTTLRMELKPQVWIKSNDLSACARAADIRGGALENSPNLERVRVNGTGHPYASVCMHRV